VLWEAFPVAVLVAEAGEAAVVEVGVEEEAEEPVASKNVL
jgi:hypothetical protein